MRAGLLAVVAVFVGTAVVLAEFPPRLIVTLSDRAAVAARENGAVPEELSELALPNLALEPVFHIPADPEHRAVFDRLAMHKYFRVKADELDAEAAIDRIETGGAIEAAELSYPHHADTTPNDYYVHDMWGLDQMELPDAWDLHHGDSEVIVATIDTGCDIFHPDLFANIHLNAGEDINNNGAWDPTDDNGIDDDGDGFTDNLVGWDFVDVDAGDIPGDTAIGEDYGPRDNRVYPDVNGHGTHVMGTAAAVTNNGIGVAAASWNVTALPLRAGYAWIDNGTLKGSGYPDDFADAVQYAVDHGARVISISFSGSQYEQFYQDAITYARDNDVLVFASAGNYGNNDVRYPAGYDGALAVANTDENDHLWGSSNYGTWIDLCAPGVDIWSTMSNNVYHPVDYDEKTGTSMSTPNAASVAGLVLNAGPSLTDDELETLVLSNCDNIDDINPGYEGLLGEGRLNALQAMAQFEGMWTEHAVADNFDGAQSVHAADVDGDGDTDVLGAADPAGEITWWENLDGAGTNWSELTVDGAFDGARSVYAADVDGDGDTDVLGAAAYAYEITWWENLDGIGESWSEHTVDGAFDGARSVYAADVDGDGDTDVLGAAREADEITWWENLDGIGESWSEHTVDGAFDGAYDVHAADVDGDGDTDVLGAAYYANEITWWENLDGIGESWSEHTVDGAFDGAYSVYAADVDGDGDTDVLGAAYYANDITWWENLDGTGESWAEHTVDGAFDGAYSVHAADVDGDGFTDVLGAAYDDNDITWWENLDGLGENWSEHTVDWEFNGAMSVHAADVDGDGDTDVLGAADTADDISWWEQPGSPGPPPPVEISLYPVGMPIEIPAGDSFTYSLEIDFNLNHPVTGYVWSEALLPNGNVHGPMFSAQFLFAPNMYIYVENILQQVPEFAPLGDYEWFVNAGANMNNPVAFDSFPFTVVTGGPVLAEGGPGLQPRVSPASDWVSRGHEQILAQSLEQGGALLSADASDDPRGQARTAGTGDESQRALPADYALSAPYPNPFNPSTTVTVALPEAGDVTVTVYNVAGQQVAALADGSYSAGRHAFTFDARELASGLYFVRATVPGRLDEVRKLMLVR
ncbi:MAG: Thermophilic serine proteinase [Calditrichaeota bacterium]|nr:Thermophilic serine proteinase [Calditrichota bacterium]